MPCTVDLQVVNKQSVSNRCVFRFLSSSSEPSGWEDITRNIFFFFWVPFLLNNIALVGAELTDTLALAVDDLDETVQEFSNQSSPSSMTDLNSIIYFPSVYY